jgi:asparagine synthase (glutamine-hydrolysing)
VVELAEKPMLRTAPAPLLALSGAVREAGLKVVLTGEGSDELFAGYDIFRETAIRRFWARDPGSRLRPRLFDRVNAFLGGDRERGSAFLEAFYRRGLEDTEDPLYSHRIRFANTGRIVSLLEPEVAGAAAADGDPAERLAARLPHGFEKLTPLARAQYLEATTFLEGYLLHTQGDRMLMGHSVEGRFPFLDHRVAELAGRLPDRLRLRGLQEKYLLKRAVRPLVPPAVLDRVKKPYRAPIAGALVGPSAPEWARELLEPARLRAAGLFRPDPVRRLVAKCEARSAQVSETEEMALVGVLSTMLLEERLVARPALAPPAEPDRVVVGDRVVLKRPRSASDVPVVA